MRSLWMLGASFFFALMSAFVKIGSAHFSFWELVGYRSLFGVLLVGGWIAATRRSVATQHFAGHFRRSLLGSASQSVWFYAMGLLPLATGLTLNYTNPLFMASILTGAALLRGERPQWKLIAAALTGFAGVVLMLRPSVGAGQVQPALVGLTSGLLAALVALQIRELARMGEPTWRIVFYYTLFGTLWGFGGHVILEGMPSAISAESLKSLAGMGVSATLGQLCMTQALGARNILVSSVLQYSAILFATAFGYLFFGDSVPPGAALGIGLIMVSGVGATLCIKRPKA